MKKPAVLIEFMPKEIFDSIPDQFEDFVNHFLVTCTSKNDKKMAFLLSLVPMMLSDGEMMVLNRCTLRLHSKDYDSWRWFSENFYFLSLYFTVVFKDFDTAKELLQMADEKLSEKDDNFTKALMVTLGSWLDDPDNSASVVEFLYSATNHHLTAFNSLLCLVETVHGATHGK